MKSILLAAADPPWAVPFVCISSLVLFFFLLLGFFKLVRLILSGTDSLGSRDLQKAYEGISVSQTSGPDATLITFRTYTGFLMVGTCRVHHLALPPKEALVLLKRLHYFNLKYGWFYPGGIFVPSISLVSYFSQTRMVRSQLAASHQNAIHEQL